MKPMFPNVWSAVRVSGRLISGLAVEGGGELTPLLSTMNPAASAIALPVRRYPMLVLFSEWNAVPAGKSLTFASWAAPAGKTKSSPGCGATSPTQLAAVVQLALPPPPSQVATAGARRDSRRSRRRVVGFMDWAPRSGADRRIADSIIRTPSRGSDLFFWATGVPRGDLRRETYFQAIEAQGCGLHDAHPE